VAHTTHLRFERKAEENQVRCSACGHLETEHGMTGTRPCLAVAADLLDRHFCACDQFQPNAAREHPIADGGAPHSGIPKRAA